MRTEIRELSPAEIKQVSGGNPWAVVTLVGAVMGAAYKVGSDLAHRDNLLCKAPG